MGHEPHMGQFLPGRHGSHVSGMGSVAGRYGEWEGRIGAMGAVLGQLKAGTTVLLPSSSSLPGVGEGWG